MSAKEKAKLEIFGEAAHCDHYLMSDKAPENQ